MNPVYITNIKIESVRHLKNIDLPLSSTKKHLMITGKNGCGKTSFLDALSKYLLSCSTDNRFLDYLKDLEIDKKFLEEYKIKGDKKEVNGFETSVINSQKWLENSRNGLDVTFNIHHSDMYKYFNEGKVILAYYKADRSFVAEIPKHIEATEFNDFYKLEEKPSAQFVKYLADLKVKQAMFYVDKKFEEVDQIDAWFRQFENLLKRIFDDESLELVFNNEDYSFSFHMKDRQPFSFNTLSSGYAAVLDIVVDLMMRMEKNSNRSFIYNMPGIVLIDEIETHLHLELQKNILAILTSIFPNIQFIVSTHSPFILNSLNDSVVYDLENKTLVNDGLSNYPYEGIVEGYFRVESLSKELKEKFIRYKELTSKEKLNETDFLEIAKLQHYLDEIPDYLALDIDTEYKKIKLEFNAREDL